MCQVVAGDKLFSVAKVCTLDLSAFGRMKVSLTQLKNASMPLRVKLILIALVQPQTIYYTTAIV